MNKGDILKLADRVEALGGPDREVDCLISAAIDLRVDGIDLGARYFMELWGVQEFARYASQHQNIWSSAMPRFTASLDAAMTLVPEEFSWEAGQTSDGGHATVSKMPVDDDAYSGGRLPAPDIQASAYAATPALAITAAALRAIAATMEDGHG